MKYTFDIKKEERLDEALRTLVPIKLNASVSNAKIRRLIISGSVYVNKRQCRNPSYIVKRGDFLTANIEEDKFFYEKKPLDINFILTEKDVLFEDEYIM